MKTTAKNADLALQNYTATPGRTRDVDSVVRAVLGDLLGAVPILGAETLSSLGITREQLPQLASALTAAFGAGATAKLKLHGKLTPAAIAAQVKEEAG